MPLIQQIVSSDAGFTDDEIESAFDNLVLYASRVLGLTENEFYGPNADVVNATRMRGRDMVFIITLHNTADRVGFNFPDERAHRLAALVANDMLAVGQDRTIGVLLVHANCGWGEN